MYVLLKSKRKIKSDKNDLFTTKIPWCFYSIWKRMYAMSLPV